MRKTPLIYILLGVTGLSIILFGLFSLQTVHANPDPSYTTTVMAGPYMIDIQVSQGTPFTDQPFDVIVMAHDRLQHLSGQVIAKPGLGTDAANIYTTMTPRTKGKDVLQGTLRLPVRGAWQIVLELNGASGYGTASVDVVAAAPGAMPTWAGWLIGSIPALGLLIWMLHQFIYRRKLIHANGYV